MFAYLLRKVGIELAVKSNWVVMDHSGVFVGEGSCSDGIYVLNVKSLMKILLCLLILLIFRYLG